MSSNRESYLDISFPPRRKKKRATEVPAEPVAELPPETLSAEDELLITEFRVAISIYDHDKGRDTQ